MQVRLNRRSLLALSVAGALSLGTPLAGQEKSLRLAFIPQENPDKLLGDIAAITNWLAEQIGAPVEGFVTIDHAAAVEALRNGDAPPVTLRLESGDRGCSGALPNR